MIDFLVHLAYLVSGIIIGGALEYFFGVTVRKKISNAIASIHPTNPPIPPKP